MFFAQQPPWPEPLDHNTFAKGSVQHGSLYLLENDTARNAVHRRAARDERVAWERSAIEVMVRAAIEGKSLPPGWVAVAPARPGSSMTAGYEVDGVWLVPETRLAGRRRLRI